MKLNHIRNNIIYLQESLVLFMLHETAKNLLHRHRLTHVDSRGNVEDTNTQTEWSQGKKLKTQKTKLSVEFDAK